MSERKKKGGRKEGKLHKLGGRGGELSKVGMEGTEMTVMGSDIDLSFSLGHLRLLPQLWASPLCFPS